MRQVWVAQNAEITVLAMAVNLNGGEKDAQCVELRRNFEDEQQVAPPDLPQQIGQRSSQKREAETRPATLAHLFHYRISLSPFLLRTHRYDVPRTIHPLRIRGQRDRL